MPRLILGLLAAAMLLATGCGADSVGSEEPTEAGEAPGAARIETVMRFTAFGRTHEHRTSQTRDEAHDLAEIVDAQTGCRTIVVGNVSYAELPPEAGLPDGKRWVRYEYDPTESERLFEESLEEAGQASADGSVNVALVATAGPTSASEDSLDELREVAAELQTVGREDVRGEPTTHYRTRVDAARRTRRTLEADGWKPENVERYLEQVDAVTEEIDLWVDERGRVRRVTTTTPASPRNAGTTVVTTDYLDFGVEVAIEPPPPAEVVDAGDWRGVVMTESTGSGEVDPAPEEMRGGGWSAYPGASGETEPVAPPSCLH